MKNVVAREHDRVSSTGSVASRTPRQHAARPNEDSQAVRVRLAPNPLWVITIGMAVFFAMVGALIAAGG